MEIAAQFNSKVAPQHPLVVGAMNRQAQLQDEPEIFLQPADIRGIVQTVRQCGWNGGSPGWEKSQTGSQRISSCPMSPYFPLFFFDTIGGRGQQSLPKIPG